MKHNWTVTLMLIAFFVLAQVIGLWLINKESTIGVDPKTNQTAVLFSDTAVGARPETTGSGSLIYILIAVAVGTGLVLLIVKLPLIVKAPPGVIFELRLTVRLPNVVVLIVPVPAPVKTTVLLLSKTGVPGNKRVADAP